MSGIRRQITRLTALLCAAALLTLCGCSLGERKAVMSINGVAISNDVATYFLDKAYADGGNSGTYEAVSDNAGKLAARYFKTNSYAHAENLSLTMAQKAAVSEKVSGYWGVYGQYYEKIGVTRATLTKIFTADAYRDALVLHLYGKGGRSEIDETRLFAQFRTEYIVFQVINGYFTATDEYGVSRPLTDAETEAIVIKFQNMANLINAGEKTMEEAAEYLAASGYRSSAQTVILGRGDAGYPSGFFDKVQATPARKATVIGTSDYIFLVRRGDADSGSEYFAEKRDEMVRAIVGDQIDTLIENYMQTTVELDAGAARPYFSIIQQEKGETT